MTRHRELLESDALAAAFPIFRDAERVIADPVVRNRGTLGGSLCQADPSEDLSAVCTTLDAVCLIRGPVGRARGPDGRVHRGPYETAVGDGEILIEVRIPVRPSRSSAYEKVERRAGDWAVDGGRRGRHGSTADAIAAARVGPGRGGPEPDRAAGDLRGAGRPARHRGDVRRGGPAAPRRAATRSPTCAAAPNTSATWPTN